MQCHRALVVVWWLGLFIGVSPLGWGGPPAGKDTAGSLRKDIASLDMEQLLNIKVTTASKFAERLADAPGVGLDRRYNGIVNPNPEPYHLLSCQFRVDLSRRLRLDDRKGVALFIHGENLANYQVWLPNWGDNGGDTAPLYRGRTVYFGV